MKKLLIAGIPGTGKTTTGDYLEKELGYLHIDMEENHRTSEILENTEDFIQSTFPENTNIVATWGFSPDNETLEVVKKLQLQGFEMIWFDGNREMAQKACLARPGFDEETLRVQMESLDAWRIPQKTNAKVINVFDKNGNFRNTTDIANEIGAL